MAKKGLELGKFQPILQNSTSNKGWALCVGAGISSPAFPNWNDLVKHLIELDIGVGKAKSLADFLLDIYSPDSIIQASQDRLNLEDDEFTKKLVGELYRLLSQKLTSSELFHFTKCLVSHSGDLSRAEWRHFLEIVRIKFPNLTALHLANVINKLLGTDNAPAAILSFNAEPLLAALINAVYREGSLGKRPPSNRQAQGKKILDIVTHSISSRQSKRIPFIFCHGLLPVPNNKHSKKLIQAIDKLVFSESEYLQLTNSSFSWQSSAFLDVCISRTVVFIGVSLSDPDMRRWLSWIHTNRLNELKKFGRYKGPSTTHYWIRSKPSNDIEKRWIESSVCHLGIRLIWIDKWSQTTEAFYQLLGIS